MPGQGYERVRRFSPPPPLCARGPLPHGEGSDSDSRPQVAANEVDDSPATSLGAQRWPPASPPPSFHSRSPSPADQASRRLLSDDPLTHEEDRTLADTFDSDSDDDEDGDGRDDRQRLMRGNPPAEDEEPVAQGIQRRVTELPTFNTQAPTSGRVYGGGNGGVWANLSAKPTRGEDAEEKPPVCTASYHIGTQSAKCDRRTNRLLQTQHRRTGRRPSSPLAPLATKSLLKAFPSARSSASSGTP